MIENFKTELNRIKSELNNFVTIVKPDFDKPDWWAGAPSVSRSLEDKKFYLSCRMREAESRRGRCGYEIRIFESNDGINFNLINKINRVEVKLPVFERPCLVQDPNSKKFKFFGCSEFIEGWGVWKLDDVTNPQSFDSSTLHRVLVPELPTNDFVRVVGYKDPFIFYNENNKIWHMFVIGFDRVERTYHFISSDGGESWQKFKTQPILENVGWHNFFTRPACVLPLEIGFLFIYEGSNVFWRDPVYNIATGIAFTMDLINFYDLTPNEPFITSPTPGNYITWRYSHWINVSENNEVYVYYESACHNDTNEVRLSKFKTTNVMVY